MFNIPEEVFINICNLNYKKAKTLKMTDVNISRLINNDILIRLKIKDIID